MRGKKAKMLRRVAKDVAAANPDKTAPFEFQWKYLYNKLKGLNK